jgi:hypothetical protein
MQKIEQRAPIPPMSPILNIKRLVDYRQTPERLRLHFVVEQLISYALPGRKFPLDPFKYIHADSTQYLTRQN